jgi:hypothetical protein
MMTNIITQLLESVAETGTLLTTPEIEAAGSRGGHSERQAMYRAIRKASHEIRGLAQGKLQAASGDVDAEIRTIIDDCAERFAAYVDDDPSAVSSATNKLVDGIVAAGKDGGGTATNQQKRAAAKDARQRAAPLRELLQMIAHGQTLTDKDLDALSLRPDLDDAGRAEFRKKLVSRSARIESMARGGDYGNARAAAAQYSAELGDALAGPRREDPAEGVEDPRELADLIRAAGRR